MKYKRLGDMLIDMGFITEQQLRQALDVQKETKERLGQVLIGSGFITETELTSALEAQLGIDFIDLRKTEIDPSVKKLIPKELAETAQIVPVKLQKDTLYLAMADPMNFMAAEQAKDVSHKRIVPLVANQSAVAEAIAFLYEDKDREVSPEPRTGSRGSSGWGMEPVNDMAPAAQQIDRILRRAQSLGSSQPYLELHGNEMTVRMRIDGVLHRIMVIPEDMRNASISWIRSMCRIPAGDRFTPQEGETEIMLGGRKVRIRVSILPAAGGERIAMSLQPMEETLPEKEIQAADETEQKRTEMLLSCRSGLIVLAGSIRESRNELYTILEGMSGKGRYLTLLDTEMLFHLHGTAMVRVGRHDGLTWSSAMQAVIGQKPDVIGIGELTDPDTVKLAMQAALSGCLVIACVQSADAAGAVDRLRSMGAEPYQLSACVRGIMTRQTVRKICPACVEEYSLTDLEKQLLLSENMTAPDNTAWKHGRGCDRCLHTGYHGLETVNETVLMTDAFRRGLMDGADSHTLRRIFREEPDYLPLAGRAARLAAEGITSAEEVLHLVRVDNPFGTGI